MPTSVYCCTRLSVTVELIVLVAMEVVDNVDGVLDGRDEEADSNGVGCASAMGTRSGGRTAGRGCALCVVVFNDSSNASGGIALAFTGKIPVLAKADKIVDGWNAQQQAVL
jgi:hypothetical protein